MAGLLKWRFGGVGGGALAGRVGWSGWGRGERGWGCWLERRVGALGLAGREGGGGGVLYGGSMKYLFDCLHVRAFKNLHRKIRNP